MAEGVKGETALILRLTRRPPITLSDVARKAGVSVSYVSACAHGHKHPSRRLRVAAETLLGHPADELFPQRADQGDTTA